MNVTRGLVANTLDADVSVCEVGAVGDLVARERDLVAIIDAEMELVALVPRSKADAVCAILNWSDSNAPFDGD